MLAVLLDWLIILIGQSVNWWQMAYKSIGIYKSAFEFINYRNDSFIIKLFKIYHLINITGLLKMNLVLWSFWKSSFQIIYHHHYKKFIISELAWTSPMLHDNCRDNMKSTSWNHGLFYNLLQLIKMNLFSWSFWKIPLWKNSSLPSNKW